MEDSLDTRYREPSHSNKFPGAIKVKTHLFSVMRDNKTWCFAQVISIRKKINEDEDDNTNDKSVPKQKVNDPEADNGHHRDSSSSSQEYEYYVTYLEHERRNDRWVPESCVFLVDDDRVNQELSRLDDKKRKQEEEDNRYRFM